MVLQRVPTLSIVLSTQPQLCCHKGKYHCSTNTTNLQHTLSAQQTLVVTAVRLRPPVTSMNSLIAKRARTQGSIGYCTEDTDLHASHSQPDITRGYKGKMPHSRRLTASLFINAHETVKEKWNLQPSGLTAQPALPDSQNPN
eukprot:1157639-Pelagomonas_calceolata.AAC.2